MILVTIKLMNLRHFIRYPLNEKISLPYYSKSNSTTHISMQYNYHFILPFDILLKKKVGHLVDMAHQKM